MKGVNKAMLLGTLVDNPELKPTNLGTPYISFNLVTSVDWETADGKTGERSETHRIVAWEKLAEKCSNMLRKGSHVYIEGKLQTRSWEDNAGVKKYITEIVAQQIQILKNLSDQLIRREEPPLPGNEDIPF